MLDQVSRLSEMAQALRIRKGFSQVEVALAYGYTQPYISMLERGALGDKDVRAYLDFLAVLTPIAERAGGNLRVKRKREQDVSENTTAFEVLTSRSEVAVARKTLRKLVAANASKPWTMTLGHQGNTWNGKVYYLEPLDMWTVFDDGETELWNTYGLGDPTDSRMRNMICHLSVPIEGINRRIGAVYAKSRNGDVVVLHRGKIGGGREGVGKSAFFEHYDGRTLSAADGGRVTDFALVGSIKAKSFLKDIRRFVLSVRDIKAQVTR